MVGRKIQEKINNIKRQYLDPKYKAIPDVIRLNRHNTSTHEIAKTIVAFNLMKEGYEIYTEVNFKGGGIGDIFVPEKCLIIEILASETVKELLTKTEKYPFGLDINYEYAKDIIDNITG